MRKVGWILMLGFLLMGSVLLAEDDPYQGWTKSQLKAEITRLKKQLEELQPKEKPYSSDDTMATTTPADKDLKVDDFESDHPSFGGGWWAGGDQNNMGTTVSPDPYERLKGGSPKSPGYCAGIKGHLGPNEPPWAWASLTLSLGTEGGTVDLTPYKALRFYTKGDGKTHRVSLDKAVVKDYSNFNADFTSPKNWTQVTIPFEQFSQRDGGLKVEKKFDDVKDLSFTPETNDADYDFKIDDVEFLK